MAIAFPRADVPINLLPGEVVARLRARRAFVGAAGGAIALLVLLLGITVFQRMQIGNAERTLQDAQAEAATLRARVGSLRQYEVLALSVSSARTVLGSALVGDVAWARFLDDLDTHMPANSQLTSLSMTAAAGTTPAGEPSFGTVSYSGIVTTFPGLAAWLDTMSEVPGLRFVYLGSGSKTEAGVTFSATAHLTTSMLSSRCQGVNVPCP